ncbi:unnamed protein product, partial [marine sediment metagenome]
MGGRGGHTNKVRKAHLLQPTTKETRPGRIIFFDTETKKTQITDNKDLLTLKLGVGQLHAYAPGKGIVFREEHL